MSKNIICIHIVFLFFLSSNLLSACNKGIRQDKSSLMNKTVIDKINTLRGKLGKEKLQSDSIIENHMPDINKISNYENPDSLRKELREMSIYDYNVRLFKFKRNKNTPTLESDIEENNKQVMTALCDSGYNKIGVFQEQDYVAVLLLKNEMSIDLLESTMQFTKEADGSQKNELLYNNIIGKTTKSKLYYIGLHNPNDINKVDKNLKKSDELSQDGVNFKLRVNSDVNSIGFLDDNNNVICIYKIK
jgi:hypothetical protein